MLKMSCTAIALSVLILLGTVQANANGPSPNSGMRTQCPMHCPMNCPMMQGTPQPGRQIQQPQMQPGLQTGAAMMENRSQMMLQQLGPSDQNYDQRFIDMLITHHQEAIVMGQDAERKARHSELREMARKIVNDQTKEMQQLRTWRNQWYGR